MPDAALCIYSRNSASILVPTPRPAKNNVVFREIYHVAPLQRHMLQWKQKGETALQLLPLHRLGVCSSRRAFLLVSLNVKLMQRSRHMVGLLTPWEKAAAAEAVAWGRISGVTGGGGSMEGGSVAPSG